MYLKEKEKILAETFEKNIFHCKIEKLGCKYEILKSWVISI